MSFEPTYMHALEQYYLQAQALQTMDEWQVFEKKWFDLENWPRRANPPTSVAATVARVNSLDSRKWGASTWSYGVSAEARYHYFAVFLTVGFAIRFPHMTGVDKNLEGWGQYCPYCEIETSELRDENCPACQRTLLFLHTEYD